MPRCCTHAEAMNKVGSAGSTSGASQWHVDTLQAVLHVVAGPCLLQLPLCVPTPVC